MSTPDNADLGDPKLLPGHLDIYCSFCGSYGSQKQHKPHWDRILTYCGSCTGKEWHTTGKIWRIEELFELKQNQLPSAIREINMKNADQELNDF